ncbi:MAG: hypothetical protein ACRC62_20990 [Microcoleus sp.]
MDIELPIEKLLTGRKARQGLTRNKKEKQNTVNINNHSLDREQIRSKLGLLPRRDYLKSKYYQDIRKCLESGAYSDDDKLRGSGRTTELALLIVESAQNSVVYIDNDKRQHLLQLAQGYAFKLGVDHRNIRKFPGWKRLRGNASYVVIGDHF